MEISQLKENIESHLYSVFIDSDITQWTNEGNSKYKYVYDNIACFITKSSGQENFHILLLEDEMTANKSDYDSWYTVYKISGKVSGSWFSKRKWKIFNKTEAIIKYHKDKEQYDKLKKAFETLPKKIQRKQKLESLDK